LCVFSIHCVSPLTIITTPFYKICERGLFLYEIQVLICHTYDFYADQTCATPQALAGPTVTVMNGSTTVASTTADASGTYSFSNLALGSYTITVAGYDASNMHYVGSLSFTLTGNASSTTIQTLPG